MSDKKISFGYNGDDLEFEMVGNPIPLSASICCAMDFDKMAAAIVIKACAIYMKKIDENIFNSLNEKANNLRAEYKAEKQ